MQYHNPYNLFGLEPRVVSIEKVKTIENTIEKEFANQSQYNYVNYNGTRLQLSELMRVLSELKDAKKLSFHSELFKHNELLNFLEYGHIGYLKHRSEYEEDKEIMEFFAPYFAYQYSETLLQAVKTRDLETLKLLKAQALPLESENEKLYYYDTEHYLEEELSGYKLLQEDEKLYVMSERELKQQLPENLISIYNNLPEKFSSFRESLADSFIQMAEQMYMRIGRREGADILLKEALKLQLSGEKVKYLKSVLKQLNPGFGKMPLFLIIGISIIALLFLLKWLENSIFSN